MNEEQKDSRPQIVMPDFWQDVTLDEAERLGGEPLPEGAHSAYVMTMGERVVAVAVDNGDPDYLHVKLIEAET